MKEQKIEYKSLTLMFFYIFTYGNYTDLLDMCAYLDPKTKSMPYLNDEERKNVHKKVFDMCVQDCNSRQVDECNDTPASPTLHIDVAIQCS